MAQAITHGTPESALPNSSDSKTASSPQYTSRLADPYRSVLLLKFALLNILAFALLAVAWSQGYIARVCLLYTSPRPRDS